MLDDSLNHLDNLLNYYNEVKDITQHKPLLNGEEIMQILNLKPSKKVGEIMEEIKEMQLSGEIKTKDEAIDYLKKSF